MNPVLLLGFNIGVRLTRASKRLTTLKSRGADLSKSDPLIDSILKDIRKRKELES